VLPALVLLIALLALGGLYAGCAAAAASLPLGAAGGALAVNEEN
jgi:hypothetical protein